LRHDEGVRFAALVVLLALVPGAAAAGGPTVALTRVSPAAVKGAGFRPQERVVVSVAASSGRFSKVARANGRGSFTVRFARSAATSGCARARVAAVGALGERASWVAPQLDCVVAQGAAIRLVSADPLEIAGNGFPAASHVDLSVTAGSTKLDRSLPTSATGTFDAAWPTGATHGCRPSAIVAADGGLRVVLHSPVRVGCGLSVVLP
jgi:hypothetical protein